MGHGTLFTLIIIAGVLVSMAGIYHEVNRSDMIGAGIFFLQGIVFLSYYFLRTGRVRKVK